MLVYQEPLHELWCLGSFDSAPSAGNSACLSGIGDNDGTAVRVKNVGGTNFLGLKLGLGTESISGTVQVPINTPIALGLRQDGTNVTAMMFNLLTMEYGEHASTRGSIAGYTQLRYLMYDASVFRRCYGMFFWPRHLGFSEQQSFARNPWQLFAPPARRLYFDVGAALSLAQTRYRWRNDDGSETGATWAAAENTAITLAQNTPRRLRVQVQSTNDKPSASYKLQYRKVGDPGWDDVT